MYRIFKDDCTILLVDSLEKSIESGFFYWENQDREAINQLIMRHPDCLYFYHGDLEELFYQFRSKFISILAAGGLVFNSSKELLLIYRHGKWDLPKGKVEENEEIELAAIREVQEECGLIQIELLGFFERTYHIYDLNAQSYFKTTHWFLMETMQEELKPQLEEGIEEVKWTPIERLEFVFQNTFQNIKELISRYLLSL